MDMALQGTDNLLLVKEAVDKLKKVPPIIEVSAHEEVNVDLCFLVLAHLIDSKKPRTRVIPYEEAKLVVDIRVKKIESSFQAVLDWKLVDFTMETEAAIELVKKEVEWQSVAQLKGTERCKKLVKLKMSELWLKAVEKQKKMFFEVLPGSISTLLQDVTLTDTVDSCLTRVMNHEQFHEHFVNVERWEENKEFLFRFSIQVPVSILKGEGGLKCIQEHMQQLQSVLKEERAKVKIKSVLENTSALLPGTRGCLDTHSTLVFSNIYTNTMLHRNTLYDVHVQKCRRRACNLLAHIRNLNCMASTHVSVHLTHTWVDLILLSCF